MAKKKNKIKKRTSSTKAVSAKDLTFLPVIIGTVLMFSPPFFWVRTAAFFLFIAGIGWWAVKKRMRRQAVLLFAFLFAYIISPYWQLSLPVFGIPVWVSVSGLLILAFSWSAYHAGDTKANEDDGPDTPGIKEIGGWSVIFVIWGFLQAKGLFVDIPWRGDEDSHFNHSTGVLVGAIEVFKKALDADTFYYFPLAAVVFFAAAFLVRWGYRRYGKFSGGVDFFLTFNAINNAKPDTKQGKTCNLG